MTTRQLVVYEADPAAPGGGRMFALDPGKATGVPIPAFSSGPTLPKVGTPGQGFVNTTSKEAFVFDQNLGWVPVVPSPVLSYATEAALLADTAATKGAYAAAGDTGNFFIKTATDWRLIGIHAFPDVATLLAANLPDDSMAMASKEALPFVRIGGAWKALGQWTDTEANIRANTSMPVGQVAVASDTGRSMTWDGTKWIGQPVEYYPTEAALLAATPAPGVLAWADDTQVAYARTSTGWKKLGGGATVTVSPTRPTAPTAGDIHLAPGSAAEIWDGAKWVPVGGEEPGFIKMWPTMTPPGGYLLCDGAAIPPQYPALIALIGPNTPDLRDQFVRGAKSQAEIDKFTKHQWTTGGPRNPFTTDDAGQHHHTSWWRDAGVGNGPYQGVGSGGWFGWESRDTSDAGQHHHSVAGGGDSETAPDHVRLAFVIKAI